MKGIERGKALVRARVAPPAHRRPPGPPVFESQHRAPKPQFLAAPPRRAL